MELGSGIQPPVDRKRKQIPDSWAPVTPAWPPTAMGPPLFTRGSDSLQASGWPQSGSGSSGSQQCPNGSSVMWDFGRRAQNIGDYRPPTTPSGIQIQAQSSIPSNHAPGYKADGWRHILFTKDGARTGTILPSNVMASPSQFSTSDYQRQSYLQQLMSLNGKVPSRNGEIPQVSQDGVSMLRFPNYISFSSEANGNLTERNPSFFPLAPVTPDKFNRAQGVQSMDDTDTGSYRITGERGLNMNNTGFSGRDPKQTCLDLGTEANHYYSSIGFYSHLQSQEQGKDGNKNANGIKVNFVPFAPVTPDKLKAAEVGQTSEVIDLVDDGETVGNKQQENASFRTRVKPTEICSDREVSTEVQLQSPPSDDPLPQMENRTSSKEENSGTNMDKTPQQKPRRRKHRPKVIKEGKSARKARQATPKSADTSEIPRVKRKYVRKKGTINSPETPETGIREKDTVSKTDARKSVKRALNFDSEEVQIIDGLDATTVSYKGRTELNNITKSSNDCSNINNYTQNVTERVDEATLSATNVSFDLNCSGNQLPDKSVKFQEDSVTASEFSRRRILRENLKILSRQRNRIRITSNSDSTMPSGLQNCPQLSMESMYNSNSFLNPQPASDSISNLVARPRVNFYFTGDKASDKARSCGENIICQNGDNGKISKDMNCVSGYQWTYTNLVNHLSAIHNKKRVENGEKDLMPNVSSEVPPTSSNYIQNLIDSRRKEFSFADTQMSYNKLKAAEHVPGQTERKRRKLPETQKEASKFAPLRVIFRCGQQPSALTNGLNNDQSQETAKTQSVNEVEHPKVTSKRQRKKISPLNFNYMPSHSDSQPKASALLREQTEFVAFPKGNFQKNSPHHLQNYSLHNSLFQRDYDSTLQSSRFYEGNVPYIDAIDLLIQKLKILFIRDCPEESKHLGVEQQNALVPYNGGGMIVPFESLLDTSKKRRSRAKVDLDSETNRVWMLLMGKDGSEGLGTGVDKEKWWEEERLVFRGRVDSFIARMHLVQGDRRFSRWKGSVVDSVVGVFLTQNVSDHLSSSAFMSVAARFPFCSRSKNTELDSEITNVPTKHEALSSLDSNNKLRGDLKMPNECDADRYSEKSKETSSTQEAKLALGGQTVEQIEECAGSILPGGENFKACEGKENADMRLQRDLISSSLQGVDFEETQGMNLQESLPSSQGSVISSENSSESPIHTTDQIRSNSETSSKTEYMLARDGWNCMDSSTPFMELLRMAGTNMLHDLSSSRKETAPPSSTHSLVSGGLEKREPTVDNPCNFHDVSQSMRNFNSCYIAGQQDSLGLSCSLSLDDPDSIPNSCSTTNSFAKNTCEMDSHEKSLLNSDVDESYVSHSKPPIQPVSYPLNDNFFDKQSRNHNYSSKANEINRDTHQQIGIQCELETNIKGGTENIVQTYDQKIHKQKPDSTQHVTVERGTSSSTTINKDTVRLKFKADACVKTEVSTETEKNPVRHVKVKVEKEKKDAFDWDSLRKETLCNNNKKERSSDTLDSVDWETVRTVDIKEISDTIRERGMNNKLAQRIQDFLNRLVREHGSIDLEWLRDVPPDKAKDYLLSIPGLGLKSVECVRLLTLHHLAFPVDTNVGRICVRLGWVPLQPLPESLQLHLLEMYPLLETIQKYLWPRLCTLDQRTLYELHYQLITFGKVFCTKSKPNCNACPMRGECKHFASAFASARLALPGPEEKGIISSTNPIISEGYHEPAISPVPLPQLEGNNVQEPLLKNSEPIIEEPATPEPECVNSPENDIEDFYEDPDEIPTIKLNIEQFTQNLQSIMQSNNSSDIQDIDMSKALVALNPEAASIPLPKLKNISRLRTEHHVYELPDSHPLLEGLEQREADDPCPYLLAIWTPGETAESMEPPDLSCSFQDKGVLCERSTCFACNSIRETQAHKVRGTILIPCRTAMRGSFPLNGTYFQVNEVFADHGSSLNPIDVPREWIWNLPRRTVYFGTSVPSIFKGLTTEGIQHCFWRGFICVRGFDQKTRAPRPLIAKLHFPASKVARNKKAPTKL